MTTADYIQGIAILLIFILGTLGLIAGTLTRIARTLERKENRKS